MDTILLNENGFIYKILTPEYRDHALIVLARAFCTESVCSALSEIKKEMTSTLSDWIEFVDYWMDHCCSNGMSVIAIRQEYLLEYS
jgi:hypothetical protein